MVDGDKMFEKKDKKLELVKEMLGTRNAYMEVVKDIDLTEDERTLLMRASSQIKKENPNSAVIAKAYAILIGKVIEEEKEGISKIQLSKDYIQEHVPAIGEDIVDVSKKALDKSSNIADDAKKTIEEDAPEVKENLKKASNKTNDVKKLIVGIFLVAIVVILFVVYEKSSSSKTNIEKSSEHKIENSSMKTKDNIVVVSKANSPENQTVSDLVIDATKNSRKVKCNTKLSTLSKDCTNMYNIYRAEYTYVQNNGRFFSAGTCKMRKGITFRDAIEPRMEEKCDHEVAGFIIVNTQTLGCMQVIKREDFLFKKEYCKKHIR